MNQEYTKAFDAYYYAHDCGSPYERNEQWLNFFDGIAERIVEEINPKTVLDAGCAMGFLVEGLRTRGVDAWGVDVSDYAIGQVHESIKAYCLLGSITQPFKQKVDLITCIEVLEHMPPNEAERGIENLCNHSDDILFSSTPFDYKESTHYNVQPPEYWSRIFAKHGFYRDVDFDASFITAWAVRYCLNKKPTHQVIYDYERRFWLLSKERFDLRQLSNEQRNQITRKDQSVDDLSDQLTIEKLNVEMILQELMNANQEIEKKQDFFNYVKNSWEQTQKALETEKLETEQLRISLEKLELEVTQTLSALEEEKREKEQLRISLEKLELEVTQTLNVLEEEKREKEQLLEALKTLTLETVHNQETLEAELQQLRERWEALEKTRTWKFLKTIYKLRK